MGISFLFHVLLFIQSLFDDCFHFEHLFVRRRILRKYDPGEIPVYPCIGMGRVAFCLSRQEESVPCRQYLPVRGKEPDTVYGDTFHRVAEDVPNSPVSTHIVILLEEFVQQGFILAGFFYLLPDIRKYSINSLVVDNVCS